MNQTETVNLCYHHEMAVLYHAKALCCTAEQAGQISEIIRGTKTWFMETFGYVETEA